MAGMVFTECSKSPRLEGQCQAERLLALEWEQGVPGLPALGGRSSCFRTTLNRGHRSMVVEEAAGPGTEHHASMERGSTHGPSNRDEPGQHGSPGNGAEHTAHIVRCSLLKCPEPADLPRKARLALTRGLRAGEHDFIAVSAGGTPELSARRTQAECAGATATLG